MITDLNRQDIILKTSKKTAIITKNDAKNVKKNERGLNVCAIIYQLAGLI